MDVEKVFELLLSDLLCAVMGLHFNVLPLVPNIWGELAYASHQSSTRVLIDFAIRREITAPL